MSSGKNIVKGNKLVYNIVTGKSSLVSGDEPQNGKKRQRVKGVFIPGGW